MPFNPPYAWISFFLYVLWFLRIAWEKNLNGKKESNVFGMAG